MTGPAAMLHGVELGLELGPGLTLGHGHGLVGDDGGWLPALGLAPLPVLAYLVAVLRRRRAGRPWSRWRTGSWVLGWLLVVVALSPPLAGTAHADARGHMAQHLLLGMYAPLALVLAAPATLLLGTTGARARRPVAAVLRQPLVHAASHPVTAGVLSAGGLWVLYLTPLYAVAQQRPAVHGLVMAHFVLSGSLLAWSVAGPDPAPRRPGLSLRTTVLVLTAASHAVLARLLYERAGELPPGAGHPAAEVEAAARLMGAGGDLAELLLAVALFGSWYQRRVRADRRRGRPAGKGLTLTQREAAR